MSSPLDARIRHIAREEASGMFTNGATGAPGPADTDRVTALEGEVAELRDRLEKLENATLSPPAKRATRKTPPETSE